MSDDEARFTEKQVADANEQLESLKTTETMMYELHDLMQAVITDGSDEQKVALVDFYLQHQDRIHFLVWLGYLDAVKPGQLLMTQVAFRQQRQPFLLYTDKKNGKIDDKIQTHYYPEDAE